MNFFKLHLEIMLHLSFMLGLRRCLTWNSSQAWNSSFQGILKHNIQLLQSLSLFIDLLSNVFVSQDVVLPQTNDCADPKWNVFIIIWITKKLERNKEEQSRCVWRFQWTTYSWKSCFSVLFRNIFSYSYHC